MYNWRARLRMTAIVGVYVISASICYPSKTPLGIVPVVLAQSTNTANLNGTVVDVQGAVVPDVNITAMSERTGLQRHTTTNDVGYFTIPFLPPGTYTLTAEMPGFGTVTINGVVLQVSINSNVQITLGPQGVTEAVLVEGARNAIDISNATIKHSVSNTQIEGLPVFTSTLGRTVLNQLAFLVPGVTPTSAGGTSGNRGEDISINGSRPSSISFNFEGGDNNDHENNRAASPMPNPDALKEFTVVTNSYQADLGRSAGGVINATAKSGSNEFHGNVRFFWRNEAFNSRGFFEPIRGKDRLNTFGGNIGGPVRIPWLFNGKDRTHFFFDYEGTRADNNNIFSRNLLTPAQREGDFSATVPLLRDPASGLPCTTTDQRGCFPGARIPADRISPVAKAYLNYIPMPNNPALGPDFYTEHFANGQQNNQITLRIDQKLSSSDHLSGTYFLTYTDNEQASTTTLPIGSMQTSKTKNHNIVLRETHTFSPRTVNEFTGTVTRYLDSFTFPSPLAGIHPRDIGITGVNPQTENFLAVPTVVIAGTGVQIAAVGGNRAYKTAWQIKDDVSHLLGTQSLKFGGEVRGFIYNKYLANNNGSFGFSNANTVFGTGNAIADFLLGIPNSFGQSTGNVLYPRQKAYYFYGMDDWKPRPNLTLNFGLRYELTPPLIDENDQFSVFRPGARSQRLPQAPVGLLFVGDPDPILGTVPRGTYPTDKNNFAPRLGIAYSPNPKSGFWNRLLGEGKTAVRAGWGLFYDQTYGFSATQYSFTQPFSVNLSLNSAQIAAAGGNFVNPFGTSANPFPLNLEDRNFSGTPALQPFDPTFRTAYTYQYNLTLQREFPAKLLLEVGYIGNNSFKLNRERQLNVAIVGPGSTTANLQARRIYPQFASIPSQESTGRARYDGLQVRLTRRFAGGLSFDTSYVLSKALDNGSNPQNSQLAGSDHLRWALSSFDRRHNFVVSYTYEIPALRRTGLLGRIFDGWQIGGITSYRSGVPLDITQSPDPALNGFSVGGQGNPDLIGSFVTLNPREVRTFVINGVPVTGNFWFDPNAFQLVPLTALRRGTLGRNAVIGPAYSNWSASLIKRTRIFENNLLEIRADIDNLFNHANFYFPGRTINFNTFGRVTSASPPRRIQLSARYTF